jgi:ADP-ribose pyrophosphatase YjhB (NUDIX family)
MENIWLGYAKRLQSIAETGLAYAKDNYDRERYEEVTAIATQMIASLGQVPIERIQNLVSNYSKGYTTPKVDVRGAVFKNNKILLVQEKSDSLWTLPGGFADVGFSAAENIEKEIKEEAGISVKAQRLYSVRHKAKGSFNQDARDFYKLYFICEQIDNSDLHPGFETLDVGYFGEEEIPPLSTGRVIEEDIELAWRFRRNIIEQTFFD